MRHGGRAGRGHGHLLRRVRADAARGGKARGDADAAQLRTAEPLQVVVVRERVRGVRRAVLGIRVRHRADQGQARHLQQRVRWVFHGRRDGPQRRERGDGDGLRGMETGSVDQPLVAAFAVFEPAEF